MRGLSVAVITTDTARAGGIEQLQAFTRLMKLDLYKAKDAVELSQILNLIGKVDQIVIDTSGYNPFDPRDMKKLASLIVAGDIEPILVLPAAIDASESGDIARTFFGAWRTAHGSDPAGRRPAFRRTSFRRASRRSRFFGRQRDAAGCGRAVSPLSPPAPCRIFLPAGTWHFRLRKKNHTRVPLLPVPLLAKKWQDDDYG
jgi:hypothetical protein